MSATIESDLFSMYFAVPVRGKVEGAPVVTVEGKSFPVVECYLDDLKDVGVSTISSKISLSVVCIFLESLLRFHSYTAERRGQSASLLSLEWPSPPYGLSPEL